VIALVASFLLSTNATPCELVAACRSMLPANVELSGRLVMRNRRGVSLAEHDYILTRTNAETRLTVDGKPFDLNSQPPTPNSQHSTLNSQLSTPNPQLPTPNILGTDVTASDLTLEYLWWDDLSFDAEREGETVNGQVCAVVVMRKGERTVRAWVDRKTGALMQAEEMKGEEPYRRLWERGSRSSAIAGWQTSWKSRPWGLDTVRK